MDPVLLSPRVTVVNLFVISSTLFPGSGQLIHIVSSNVVCKHYFLVLLSNEPVELLKVLPFSCCLPLPLEVEVCWALVFLRCWAYSASIVGTVLIESTVDSSSI